jgi:UDP:flavonoid glycosyltransferase YjiC (YdhE family)
MEKPSKPVVLIAPLDWGIGHASRCIPIIRYFESAGHEVILASNGRSAALLRKEFPKMTLLTDIPDYAVQYPTHGNFTLYFSKHSARLIFTIYREHRWLRRIAQQHKIDMVISDNRYGLFHREIPCHFITHQLLIPAPVMFKPLVNQFNLYFLRKFNQILIPDFAGDNNLSGALSHTLNPPNHVRFIGPISRFSPFEGIPAKNVEYKSIARSISESDKFQYDFMVIISGPEPSRSKFSKNIKNIFGSTEYVVLILEGKTELEEEELFQNLRIVNHLNEHEFRKAVSQSRNIICRSGYSTLMDLFYLGKKALLVATPGQKEQEYLSDYHALVGNHVAINERNLSIYEIKKVLSK